MQKGFQLLCSAAYQVNIVDKYSVTDAIRQDASSPGSSGLQRFLTMADAGGVSEAHIFVAEGGKIKQQIFKSHDLAKGLSSIIGPLSLADLKVYLHVLSQANGVSEMHDRWVGFSWPPGGIVSLHLGKGLGQFNGTTTGQNFGLHKSDDATVSQLVTRLTALELSRVRV